MATNIKKISAGLDIEESKSSLRAKEFKASAQAAKTARPRTPVARNVKRDAKPVKTSKRIKEPTKARAVSPTFGPADSQQPALTTTGKKPATVESDTQDANADLHVDVESNSPEQVAAINEEYKELFSAVQAPITYPEDYPSLPADEAVVLDQTFAATDGKQKPADGTTAKAKVKSPKKKEKSTRAPSSQRDELRAILSAAKKAAKPTNGSEQADFGETQPMKTETPATPTPAPPSKTAQASPADSMTPSPESATPEGAPA